MPNNDEEKSIEVQRVLNDSPPIILWGNTFLLLFIIALAICSKFIPYPDELNTPIYITSASSKQVIPQSIITPTSTDSKDFSVYIQVNLKTLEKLQEKQSVLINLKGTPFHCYKVINGKLDMTSKKKFSKELYVIPIKLQEQIAHQQDVNMKIPSKISLNNNLYDHIASNITDLK